MEKNALGRAAQAAPTDASKAERKGAGEGAHQDAVKANAGIQRDGTPTNIGTKPTNPGTKFFKAPASSPSSGMEKAMAQKFKR